MYAKVGPTLFSDKISKTVSATDNVLYVACSGGADSLFALLYTHAYCENHDNAPLLSVLHFNHALRGDASDEDERFVSDVAAALELSFANEKAIWAKPIESVSEDDARSARIRFFERAVGNCAQIVTGHHGDDIAETMLMRLSRGAGLQGLAAPREVSQCSGHIQFLRPFLEIGRSEIRETLCAVGVQWQEDESNAGDGFYRNRLRSSVIPKWEVASDRAIGPGVTRSRMLLEEDFDAMEVYCDEAWQRIYQANMPFSVSCDDLVAFPKAMQRRVLLRWVQSCDNGIIASAQVMDEILLNLSRGSSFSCDISKKWTMRSNRARLELVDQSKQKLGIWHAFRLPLATSAYLPDGARVCVEGLEVTPVLLSELRSGSCANNAVSVVVSSGEKQLSSFSVRQRRAGDAFIPHGKSSIKKLKDLLIERKIKLERRDQLPVFVNINGDILWVPGLSPSAKYLVSEDSKYALRLTYSE